MIDTECCKNCKFWDGDELVFEGACLRYPPVPVVIKAMSEFDSGLRTVWPQSGSDEWCGEFQSESEIIGNKIC